MTIYPGRASPTRRVPPRTLPGSMERHREVCRKNSPATTSSSSSSNSSMEAPYDEVDNAMNGSSRALRRQEEDALMIATVTGHKQQKQQHVDEMHPICNSVSSSQLLQQQELLSRSPPAASIIVNRNMANLMMSASPLTTSSGNGVDATGVGVSGLRHSINTNTRSAKRIGARTNGNNNSSNNSNNEKSNNSAKGSKGTGGKGKHFLPASEDSEDFSDDSLEDTSLPPPPPPPVVPPPPSLSCPVTPSKRGSIAWDINLDDPLDGTSAGATATGLGDKAATMGSKCSAKVRLTRAT